MSIIHDALKKVQQGQAPKTPPTPPTSDYIYATPAPAEPTKPVAAKTDTQKPAIIKKMSSLLAMLCALVITFVSLNFIFQQFRTDIPKVKKWVIASYCQLTHKVMLPDFKTRSPEDLKPLAQVTVPPPATPANTAKTQPPLTLNIHGVMANDGGNLVLINDRVYQEGDTVEGAKIVKIDLDSVTIINDGKEETISVGRK